MEIVEIVKAKTHSGIVKAKSGLRKRKRKCLTKEEYEESKRLFKEVNDIYRKSKNSSLTENEIKRYHKIKERLMELRVI